MAGCRAWRTNRTLAVAALVTHAHRERLSIRAVLSPPPQFSDWYGYDKTDPDYDPTIPHLGDPDWVYDLSRSSRSRAVLTLSSSAPSSAELEGEFLLTAREGLRPALPRVSSSTTS